MAPTEGSEQAYPRHSQQPRPSGGGPDQTMATRRAIAGGVIVLVLILIVLLAKGCASARKERGIKDFITQSNSIVTQSNQSSRDFFNKLRTPGDAGATEIETSINEQRALASELVRQANNLSTPGDLTQAKRYLVESLEFRRDGLTEISQLIGQALGDQDPQTATEQIAADMQNFMTSDVIYSQRAYAYMAQAIKKNKIAGVTAPSSQFLPSLDWLDPTSVDDVLSRARGGSSSSTAVTPGLHGTGITGVSALPAGTQLATAGTNDLSGAKEIQIDVQNQGENTETAVVVSLVISGSGTPIRLNKTIPTFNAGDTNKVAIALTRTPTKGTNATLKVDVKRVGGEQNLDNNSQSFDVTF